MNQIAVGLIIGGIVGFGIGLTLAPDVALSSMTEDQQELLCLEERSQLMDEVREALKKMQNVECAPATPAVEQLINEVSKPEFKPAIDAGVQALEVSEPVKVEPRKPESKGVTQKPPVSAKKPIEKVAKTSPPVSSNGKSPSEKNTNPAAWMVQLVASPDPAEAGKVERKARALGLNTRVVLEEVPDQSRSLYKVRVGPFSDKSGGVEALRRIRRELKITGWLHRAD